MRILMGPQNQGYLSDYIHQGFADHDLVTFNDRRPGDVPFSYPEDSFAEVLARLPAGWEPDLVIWWFPEFNCLLPELEKCPYPTVLAVGDWQYLSTPILEVAPWFDLVASDRHGLDLLAGVPGAQAVYARLYGYHPELHRRLPDCSPRWDLTHVGGADPAVHRDRIYFMSRLSQLGERHRVGFFSRVFGEDYVRLLNQSRISVNHTVRGEMNMRCYEVAACGSLLFCEESNQEVREYFTDREHCVLYNRDNLEALVDYYLEHEPERARLARAGWERVQGLTYRSAMNRLVETCLEVVRASPRRRATFSPLETHRRLAAQGCQALSSGPPLQALREVDRALSLSPSDPVSLNLRGCALARLADLEPDPERRLEHRRAAESAFVEARPLGAVSALNLAQLRILLGRRRDAAAGLEEALELPFREGACYPRGYDAFSLAWERHPARRPELVRWKMLDLLSELRPRRAAHYCRAALQHRDDMPATHFRLAGKLSGAERAACLRRTVELDPACLAARRLLVEELWSQGQGPEATRLALATARVLSHFPRQPNEFRKFQQLLRRRCL